MSKSLGAGFLERNFSDKLAWFRNKIDENKDSLFYYFVFLRIQPFVPDFFLNLASSAVGVPFPVFFTASLVGLSPYTFFFVKTGLTINEIQSIGMDSTTIFSLFALAGVALLPVWLTKKTEKVAVDSRDKKQN